MAILYEQLLAADLVSVGALDEPVLTVDLEQVIMADLVNVVGHVAPVLTVGMA